MGDIRAVQELESAWICSVDSCQVILDFEKWHITFLNWKLHFKRWIIWGKKHSILSSHCPSTSSPLQTFFMCVLFTCKAFYQSNQNKQSHNELFLYTIPSCLLTQPLPELRELMQHSALHTSSPEHLLWIPGHSAAMNTTGSPGH